MRIAIFSLLLAMLAPVPLISAPAAQTTALKPVRLLAEAEDFTIKPTKGVKEGWQVLPYRENYYASTFAITFLSRMGCLSAPEQTPAGKAVMAEQKVVIPSAGSYQVLARYEQPYNYSVEFTIEIIQDGKEVYSKPFGRLQDVKIWGCAGNPEARRKPMQRFWWGGTDNIVWQQGDPVTLKPGPAMLRLIAGAQLENGKPRVNAAKRNVDVICLTTDTDGMKAQRDFPLNNTYLELDGWLTQDGDLYARFTNPKDGKGPCVPIIAPFDQGQHSSYYIHLRDWPTTRVLKSGLLVSQTRYSVTGPRSLAVKPKLIAPVLDPAKFLAADAGNPAAKPAEVISDSEYLQPGQSSGWAPVGQVLDSLNNCHWYPQALYKDAKTTGLDLQLEFAVPDGKGGLKTVKSIRVKTTPTESAEAMFEMPGNIAPNAALAKTLKARFWLPEIRTQVDAMRWLNTQVARFPDKGPMARRMLFYGIGSNKSIPGSEQFAKAMGDNTVVNQQGNKRALVAHWPDVSPAYYTTAKLDDVKVISYGDETHLPAAKLTDAEFAAWLQAKGVQVDGPVKWTDKSGDQLYYYSVIAGVEKGAQPYIEATAYYQAKGALTGANYSPHANYLVSELHWVRPFKMNALTMAWSEDYVWQIPEFSVQVVGYMMTAFRCGTKYHHQPIMMYVMPHSPGNTPSDFRRAFYTDVAHGMTMVNYFTGTPLAIGATENYVDTNDLGMWREVYNVSHEAGQFEDYVMDGQVRPGKVGLLLSSVDDVMTNANNATFAMHNNERKAIYYALRHAQVPVDMLSEDDVIDGLAKDYRVIYVTQQWVHSKCLAALQRWAEDGGTVVALCGGGFMDEFNKPNPQANAFYGVKTQQITTDPDLVKKYLLVDNTPFLTKQDLPRYQPIDSVKWSLGGKSIAGVPVIVWKQKLEAGDGQVIGAFADGSPAVIRKAHGKGQAILFGFLPGEAYLKSGLPVRPVDRGSTDSAFTHFLPTGMDANLRARLVDDFLPAGYLRPVECSEPLVETTSIDTPAHGKQAVPLINYTGKPIAKLTVKINGIAAAKSVRSVERGELMPTFRNGSMIVTLPLEVADMLLIDR